MNLHISHFPKDLLQRIFQSGVENVWLLSDKDKVEHLNEVRAPPRYDEFVDADKKYKHYPDIFKPGYNHFRRFPELPILMDCAQVCKAWADAIIDEEYWSSLFPGLYAEALGEPWKLGKRWNRLLKDAPVPILCVKEELISNLGKINTSVLRGRELFEVHCLSNRKKKRRSFNAWSNLQPILQTRCSRLIITNRTLRTGSDALENTRVGFLTLKLTEWPLLQSLEIDFHGNEIMTTKTRNDMENFSQKSEHDLRSDPPFPALKRLLLCTHVQTPAAHVVTLVAPHIEHCHIIISGYEDDSSRSWEQLRTCGALRQFLREDNRYRVYITPYCIHAFKSPGPKSMRDYKEEWGIETFFRRFLVCGVLISERRDGKICELILTLDQFFGIEDLRLLSIPFIENH